MSDSEDSVLQIDMMEESSGGETEAQQVPTPPPSVHPHSAHISQVSTQEPVWALYLYKDSNWRSLGI